MNHLNIAIQDAIANSGNLKEANKAYLEFIKANFIIPIEKTTENEEVNVLFLEENDQAFLPVFSNTEYLDTWASDICQSIQILKLSGVDLLKNIGDKVTVCLDIGSPFYKEFNPNEIARMRSMVLKLFKNG